LQRIFKAFDFNGTGVVLPEELLVLGKQRGELGQKQRRWTEQRNTKLVDAMDRNKNGKIEEKEFVEHFVEELGLESDEVFMKIVGEFLVCASTVEKEAKAEAAAIEASAAEAMAQDDVEEAKAAIAEAMAEAKAKLRQSMEDAQAQTQAMDGSPSSARMSDDLHAQADLLFDEIDKTQDGLISQGEIDAFVKTNPTSKLGSLLGGTKKQRAKKIHDFVEEASKVDGQQKMKPHKGPHNQFHVSKEDFVATYITRSQVKAAELRALVP